MSVGWPFRIRTTSMGPLHGQGSGEGLVCLVKIGTPRANPPGTRHTGVCQLRTLG
jgi:hypothetical protein